MTTETLPKTESTPDPPPGRIRLDYTTWVVGTFLVLVGLLWLLDVTGVSTLRLAVLLPVLLALVGLALVLGAWNGSHGGLVVVGVLLTLTVLTMALTPVDAFRGGVGKRTHVVVSQEQLAPRYDVGMGELRLDLSELTLSESAAVEVAVGAGSILVDLPADVPVSIEASTGAGEIDLLGERADGVSVDRTYVSEGFATAQTTLSLDLEVAAGSIEVRR